jgi:hypothetical protein
MPTNRDFFLNPAKTEMGIKGGITASIMSANIAYIMARNTSDQSITILRKQRLGMAEEYTAEGCYRVAIANNAEALASGPISWQEKPLMPKVSKQKVRKTAVIPNGITLYGEEKVRNRL